MDIPSYLLGKKAGGGKNSLKYVVVEELPATGENNTIYLVPKSTSGTNNYYDEYMYINSNWELIGDTEVDLSSKQDVMQFTTLPTANASNVGKIYQYIGATNANYTNGYFYICVSDGQATPTYSWEQINVQDGASYTAGTNIEITNAGVINNGIPYLEDTQYGKLTLGKNTSIPAYETAYVIGSNSKASDASITIGRQSGTDSRQRPKNIIIGHQVDVTGSGQQSIAIGVMSGITYNQSIAIGHSAKPTKNNQAILGSSYYPINEMTIYTSSGAKVMATQDYVDNAISTAITSALGGGY